ncbi:MAG: DUF362 domain-containing protein [Desulfatiglandales bacterium]
MDRRDFLKWNLKAIAFSLLGPKFSWGSPKRERSIVVAVKGEIKEAVEAGIKELNGLAFIRPGSRVLIKPNISFRNSPDMATTTTPGVVRALVDLIAGQKPRSIKVVDNTLTDPEACMQNTGIREALRGTPAELRVVKERQGFQKVTIKGAAVEEVELMKEVLESDLLIPVPIAKHHSSAGVSLSMKGMMGLIYDRSSFHYRYDLHTAIVDLAAYLKPPLVVIDMTKALTTNGPSGPGEVAWLNTVVVSNDMVAADAYVVKKVKWYGREIEPFRVKHIEIAHKRGVGVGNLKDVEIIEKTI